MIAPRDEGQKINTIDVPAPPDAFSRILRAGGAVVKLVVVSALVVRLWNAERDGDGAVRDALRPVVPEGDNHKLWAASLERLDTNAKTLVAATTVTFTFLAALGMTTDRLPMLLDSSSAKWRIIAATLLAILATLCGFFAYAVTSTVKKGKLLRFDPPRRELVWITLGVLALISSLIMVTWAATTAFSEDGRPNLDDIAVVADGEKAVNIAFTVSAVGVSRDTLLLGYGTWVRESAAERQELPVYSSTLRPNEKGVVQQKVTLHMARPSHNRVLRLQFYRLDKSANQPTDNSASPGARCTDQGNQKTAPACAMIAVPAAVESSS